MTSRIPRIATASVAFALLLSAAACSSDDNEETGTQQSTTTAPSNGDGSGSGASDGGGSASAAADEDLCEKVPVATVAELTGAKVTTAAPLSASTRVESSSTLPSCNYNTATGLGGGSAEFISEDRYTAFTTNDPVTPVEPMSGVGDEAYKGVDTIDNTKVIRVIAKKGDRFLFLQIFSGAPEAGAQQLANQMLA